MKDELRVNCEPRERLIEGEILRIMREEAMREEVMRERTYEGKSPEGKEPGDVATMLTILSLKADIKWSGLGTNIQDHQANQLL
jgi:hypothetical protein